MTDKERMYANPLEWKLMVAKNAGHTKVTYDELNGLVETINRQQAEISEYKDKCEKCGAKTRVCIESLQNNIAEKQAEIERLEGLSKHHQFLINELNIGIAEFRAEVIKEFADLSIKKICENVSAPTPSESYIVERCNQVIYNLVKEMTEPSLLDKKFGGEQG